MHIILKLMIAFYGWLAYQALWAIKSIGKFGSKSSVSNGWGGIWGISSGYVKTDLYRKNKDKKPHTPIDRSKAFNIEEWIKEQRNKESQ